MTHPRLVIFGEVLFDCFPDGSRVLGGAPFNVAWHCQAFGLKPLFISRVGNDPLGREIKSTMLDWGMDTSDLQLDSAHPTGIVNVSFTDGEPSYEIVENSAWDFIDHQSTPRIEPHCVLYHGSLALRNPISSASLSVLKQQCDHSVFIDVNLRPPWWDLQTITNMIQQGKWIKLNAEELSLITPKQLDMESKARYLLSNFSAELIIVTLGDAGAICASRDELYRVQPEEVADVIDTVGAGDAFSSVLLLGIHKAWSLKDILNRAQQFASAVVSQRGATTRDRNFYQPFIDDWGL